jgi:beta-lactam-binding protein with PASTA domain
VPSLVGATVANARAAWTAAGFTGSFNPTHGVATKIVKTQDRAAGACMPPTTSVTVTYG